MISAIFPLLDLAETLRANWKYAEDRLRAAEERAERLDQYNTTLREEFKESRNKEREMAGQISMLKTDNSNLEEMVKDCEERLLSIKKLLHVSCFDLFFNIKFTFIA